MASPSELTQKLPPFAGGRKLLSSRRGTMALAGLAGLVALGVLLLFMSNYRDSVRSGVVDTQVLVADTFIDEGTAGAVIAEASLFKPVTIPEDELLDGAVTDLSAIAGRTATEPIYRGQQLTASSFAAGASPITGRIEGVQRALTLPIGTAQGNLVQIEAGSRVDVLGNGGTELFRGSTTAAPLATDILVLRVPGADEIDDDGGNVTLRVSDVQASEIARASNSGDVWLTVRPPTLGKESKTVKPGGILGNAFLVEED